MPRLAAFPVLYIQASLLTEQLSDCELFVGLENVWPETHNSHLWSQVCPHKVWRTLCAWFSRWIALQILVASSSCVELYCRSLNQASPEIITLDYVSVNVTDTELTSWGATSHNWLIIEFIIETPRSFHISNCFSLIYLRLASPVMEKNPGLLSSWSNWPLHLENKLHMHTPQFVYRSMYRCILIGVI